MSTQSIKSHPHPPSLSFLPPHLALALSEVKSVKLRPGRRQESGKKILRVLTSGSSLPLSVSIFFMLSSLKDPSLSSLLFFFQIWKGSGGWGGGTTHLPSSLFRPGKFCVPFSRAFSSSSKTATTTNDERPPVFLPLFYVFFSVSLSPLAPLLLPMQA